MEEECTSRGFLLDCLRQSGLEEGLVEDVCDVCVTAGCNALDLADNAWSIAEVEKKLFLTGREASQLVACCRTKCGKGGGSEGESEGESEDQNGDRDVFSADRESTSSGNRSMMTMTMTMVPSFEERDGEKRPQSTESGIDGNSPRLKSSFLECSKWPTEPSVRSQLESSQLQSPPPSHRPGNDSRSTHLYVDPPNSGSSSCSVVVVVPSFNKHLVPGGPLSVQETVEDWLQRNSPELTEEEPTREALTKDSDVRKNIASTSHLRITATSMAKQKPLQVATVLVRQVDRPKYSKTISSRFLEPTHASQMRATGTTCMNIAKDESGRPLTSEQIAFLKATEKGNQAKNQRKSERLKADFPKKRLLRQDSQSKYSQSQASHGHSLRITEAKPFFLRSTSRHEQAVRQFRDQMAIEYQAEVMAREFKAKKYCPSKPPRSMSAPAGKRVTIAEAPRLLSEQRANHWALNIKPVQDHKDIMQKKWNQEKKRSEEVAMARILKTSRRALVHQARPMPDFSEVFKPDLSLAAPSTEPISPKLSRSRHL